MVQVVARDKDAEEDPDSPAGQIEYSIVSTHKKFKIDAETGWLSTNTVSIMKTQKLCLKGKSLDVFCPIERTRQSNH